MVDSERIDFQGYFLVRDKCDGEWIMVLTGPWNDKYRQVISSQNISSLRLSYSAGWVERDITFVRSLKSIHSLEIYSWDVTDISSLAEITQLEKIGLECNYKHPIDFSRFPKLRTCFLKWRPKSESVFNATSLRTLSIVNFPYENLLPMHKLQKLENLKLTSNKIQTLDGMTHLGELITLDLFRCPSLTSFDGIQGAANLRKLDIDTCQKISELGPLGALRNLRRVTLNNCGKLKTLLSLRACTQLEELLFTENTDIEDGSIYVFKELPVLKTMWFANRKHYSNTREQVQEAINLRQR